MRSSQFPATALAQSIGRSIPNAFQIADLGVDFQRKTAERN